ncbi:flagellar assembly protein FliW [Pectinatus frisingensis]|uniref:flagellar assembly protein FliW n=1 Tax=Pectinatus frisingensis TaxID=865 RepID=UPI0018C4EAC5|nr:flagellar assembly protein FliW [Pectinatus frisingensis]
MRSINTVRFGNIKIDETKIIKFPHGIPPFEDEHEFVIIPYSEESPFLFLQSVSTARLAFLMVNPFMFFNDYEFVVNDDVMDELQIKNREDISIFSLLTIPNKDIKKTTANLLAPIIINQSNYKGLQLILENTNYTTRHLLVDKKNVEDDK